MVVLHESWRRALKDEFEAPYMVRLKAFLMAEREHGKCIFPKGSEWFRALDLTPIENVSVVILGQDPYHGEGQAHGLCFSVRENVKLPPSLLNIYKEIRADLGIQTLPHGNLERWAKQGVLLLNSVLTVEAGRAASHQGQGWELFTDAIVRLINDQPQPVAFILWGAYAQKKGGILNAKHHLVLKSPHPSPLSAHNGFFGSKPFSQTNAFLKSHGQAEIDWS
jgi:uracil-DNA glycosylase